MSNNKPRVIKDYDKLPPEIQEQIKLVYPLGFVRHLITFTNREGKKVSALPFETDDKYYLIRMTKSEARDVILQDEDYDDDGTLKDAVKEEYLDKYSDLDYIPDTIDVEDVEDTDADEEDDDDLDL